MCFSFSVACRLFPVRNVNSVSPGRASGHELPDCLPEKLLTYPLLLKGTSAICILQPIFFLGFFSPVFSALKVHYCILSATLQIIWNGQRAVISHNSRIINRKR